MTTTAETPQFPDEIPDDALPEALPDAPLETAGLWSQFQDQRRGNGRRDLLFLGTAGAWVAFDQITKVIVRDSLSLGEHDRITSFFRFSHFENEGGAFGLFGDANAFLAVSAVLAIVVLGVYYLFPVVDHWVTRLGLALVLGGAVGNFLDRIYQGSVTDFINFNEFPAFNVADSGISIGVFLILVIMVVHDATRTTTHR